MDIIDIDQTVKFNIKRDMEDIIRKVQVCQSEIELGKLKEIENLAKEVLSQLV